jgi:nucleotide-binding universal stress UspA family protein
MKIVVGIDGSAESTDALRFAAAEAGATGADLLAVTVWEVSTHSARYLSQEHVDDAMIPWMGEFIDEVLGAKGADVTKLAASGSAGGALLDAAADADQLVVGSRGLNRLQRTVLGSVSRQLASHTPCPLTVIPPADVDGGVNDAGVAASGPVVVGIDGSANSMTALQWAAQRAVRTDSLLRVTMAWRGESAGWRPAPEFSDVLPADQVLEAQAQEMLDEAIQAAALPDSLRLETLLHEGSPKHALDEAAQGASMLVLGTRGHGGFMGLLLGSVTSHTLDHLRCPTTVVPPA